ncbi:MAG: CocE/NonD family hydrolase [Chitinophagaceae bacterium]|nr:MAG: CocE/NonD family hydrolase [Chitinophagaceae bacterium]
MRKYFLTIIICLFPIFLIAQSNSQDSLWIRENYYKIERTIPMRDGVKLFTSIYIPKDTTEMHPILMRRTPYSCAPYGENNFASFWNSHIRYYLRENYIYVIQDVRGRWMSEGEFADVRPFNKNKTGKETDEASDTYDAIDWMVKNIPFNNGRVGTFGISYPGFYTTMTAASNHPALKAASPQAPVTNWFIGDDFHHNGTFFPMDGFVFYSSFGKPRPKPTTVGSPGYDFKIPDNYKFYLQTATLKNLAGLIGDSIKFWHEMYQHPNYDDWWKARDARVAMFNIKPAILTVGGLFDAEDCWGAWNLYKAIEKQSPQTTSKLVMGPWYHGQWASNDGTQMGNVKFGSNTSFWYQNNIELPFFNYYLKGKGDISKIKEANIFFTGENNWKQFSQWPPAEKQDKEIYLNAGGKLLWEKPSPLSTRGEGQGVRFSEYISDPAHPVPYTEDVHQWRTTAYMNDDQRFASRRPDVLTFETDILESDITLAGPVVADLLTSISTTDADFVVKLIDVFPDDFHYPTDAANAGRQGSGSYPMYGYQMLVRGEIFRGRFRNSFENPEAFKPNKIERVKFDLPDVAHTFLKGHRIMIQIQSTWFPLADRNPQQFVNIYQADEKDFIKSTIHIYHDGTNASKIILPVMK